MRFGSLFAGIGGLDLGLERAGMEGVWQVEIDDYCRCVLAKHWPNVERYADVRECGANNLEAVDLICGGFPCQPHSVAGKRRGKGDDRNLWPEYRRIVVELRPRWVLGENVPGIITTMLDEVLSDLEGEGYACTTITLPAVAFDAPHRRERVFIVAYATGPDAGSWAKQLQGQELADGQSPQLLPDTGSGSGETEARRDNENVADAEGTRGMGGNTRPECSRWARTNRVGWWAVEPDVGRVADGVPARVDRLRALGNAVVPQVAEWIGRRIVAFDAIRETDYNENSNAEAQPGDS